MAENHDSGSTILDAKSPHEGAPSLNPYLQEVRAGSMHLLAWDFLPSHREEMCTIQRPEPGPGNWDPPGPALTLHNVFLGQDGLSISTAHGFTAVVGWSVKVTAQLWVFSS